MNFKTCKINVKEAGNYDSGRICGYASTYDKVPDSYGDIVAPGAFTRALEKISQSGKKLPFLENHKFDDFEFNIGYVDVLEDKDKGLYFEAVFDKTERAQRARQLFIDGRISQFSFAYDILDQAPVELEDGTKANELRELDIFEISAVTVPANQYAEMVDVKGGKMPKKIDEPMQDQEQTQEQDRERDPKEIIDEGFATLFAKLEDEIREFVYEVHDIERDKACNPDEEDKKACQTDDEEDKKADKPTEEDSEADTSAEDSEEDVDGEQDSSTDEEEVDKDNSKSNERLLTFIDTLRIV